MNAEFTFSCKKLTVTFLNYSRDVEDFTLLWDFGDGSTSTEREPIHTYEQSRRYTVSLKYFTEDQMVGSCIQDILVSDKVHTTLSDTIYHLIDAYLPSDVFGELDFSQKRKFIQKWQLYLQPLVNHCVPVEEYSNELYYEALENQLIMELAAYDYMVLKVNQMVQALSNYVYSSNRTSHTEYTPDYDGENGGDRAGNVKHITTGPTEVEYFDSATASSDYSAQIIKAMKPDGLIDLLKANICMLAERLEIYLPICSRPNRRVVVPRVENRRENTFLGGPDPLEVIK